MSKNPKPTPVVQPYSFPTKQHQPYRFNQLTAHGSISITIYARQRTADITVRFDGYGAVIKLAKQFMSEIKPLLEYPPTAKPGPYSMGRHRSGDTSFGLFRVPIDHARNIADQMVPKVIALTVDLKAREATYRVLGIPSAT